MYARRLFIVTFALLLSIFAPSVRSADIAVGFDLSGVTVKSGPVEPLANYGYDWGYFDYDTLDVVGGDRIEGHYSPSLFEACSLSAPRTRIPRDDLAVTNTSVSCAGFGIGRTVMAFRVGGAAGAASYISLERGIDADCGAIPNLDARNTHPNRTISFMLSNRDRFTGEVKDYGPFVLRAGELRRDILRCAFGTAWVKSAFFVS